MEERERPREIQSVYIRFLPLDILASISPPLAPCFSLPFSLSLCLCLGIDAFCARCVYVCAVRTFTHTYIHTYNTSTRVCVFVCLFVYLSLTHSLSLSLFRSLSLSLSRPGTPTPTCECDSSHYFASPSSEAEAMCKELIPSVAAIQHMNASFAYPETSDGAEGSAIRAVPPVRG